MTDDHSALIERLDRAEGPSRELDADIYIALNIPKERAGRIDRLDGCVGWHPVDAPYVSAIEVPPYTSSIDAAVALAERVLPGCQINVTKFTANISRASLGNQWLAAENHKTPPLALCLAILRALQSAARKGGEA